MSRVSVANPYDLLADENEDRTNVPAPKPKEQKPKAPAAPAAAGAKPAAPKPAEAKPKAAASDKAAAKPAAARPQQAGGQTPPAPRDANTNLEEKSKEYRPRGQGADRRDAPHRPPPGRDNKDRAFDRKSGTGRPANENKKGGQGKGNWGGDVDPKEAAEAVKDLEGKTEEKEVAEGEKETAEGEKKEGEEGEKKEGEEGEKKEEAPKPVPELGLDEYLAKLKSKAPKVEALKPRTVSTEGFEGLTALPKEDEDGLAPTAGKKTKKDAKKTGKKEEKSTAAADLLAFPTYQEMQQKSQERRGYNRDRPPRDYGERREGGERRDNRDNRPPRDNRGPRRDNRGPRDAPAPAAPVADFKKDFPSLAPGAVKA
jgi:plasminogen activator inhibitor 1 RNA-binding protein